jgi:hypothetical protein
MSTLLLAPWDLKLNLYIVQHMEPTVEQQQHILVFDTTGFLADSKLTNTATLWHRLLGHRHLTDVMMVKDTNVVTGVRFLEKN